MRDVRPVTHFSLTEWRGTTSEDFLTANNTYREPVLTRIPFMSMKFTKELTLEFKKELFKAIKLSVFITALVFGFLIFQNETTSREEIADMKAGIKADMNRAPASRPESATTSESD